MKSRSSTFWPDLICDFVWLPVRFAEWLNRTIFRFCGWVICAAMTIFGATVVLAWQFVSWLEAGIGITTLAIGIIGCSLFIADVLEKK